MEKDLFNKIDTLPVKVQEVLNEFAEQWNDSYDMCADMCTRLDALGYTFDYYLDAIPFNLRLK